MMLIYLLVLCVFSEIQVISGYDCYRRCDTDSYCCGDNACCRVPSSYTFYSMWYFWFIVGLLILSCAASCSYYRRRRRLLALQRHMPATVVMFNTNRQHAPVTTGMPVPPGMPPTYQEATDKPVSCPPPYYSVDPVASQNYYPYSECSTGTYPSTYSGAPPEPRVFLPSTQR